MPLKPFNLQAALNGAKVVTRDGREIENFAYFPNAKQSDGEKICVVINGSIYGYSDGGIPIWGQDETWDLFLAPQTREGWCIVYNKSAVYDTREDCEKVYNSYAHTGTILAKIEWEE